MVIEEVSAIQENLEIERACRESAEAVAFKVTNELAICHTICVIFVLLPFSKPQNLSSSPLKYSQQRKKLYH